jgi:ASC-1-like (ASCH) protein
MSKWPNLIASPNSVLANALNRTIDLLRPRIAQKKPERIEFQVGTQINGTPHIGTNLVQTCAFVLAQQARRVYSIDTSVTFGALDNAPFDVKLDPESHHSYQISYFHHLGKKEITSIIDQFYRSLFEGLSERTDVEYRIQTYTEQQSQPEFRVEFLRTLHHIENLRWCIAPSSGVTPVRLPCPQCFWAEKRAERTKVIKLNGDSAVVGAFCFDHLDYMTAVSPDSPCYIDLNTLYRNVVKEATLTHDANTLYVMVKGGDWAFGCQPVDWALSLLGYKSNELPMRIFTPQILTETGAKLSKSLIRRGEMKAPEGKHAWILETSAWEGTQEDYIDTLIWLVEQFLSDPKHFFRSYCYGEVERIMKERPSFPSNEKRARGMAIYRKYFDLIANGQKTIEVRVAYSSMKRIQPGQLIRFVCQDDAALTRVIRVAEYKSFDDLLDHEDNSKINPNAARDEQLREMRRIFPPNKESLGVLAIEVERESE